MFIEIILKNIFENNALCFSDLGGKFQKNSKDVSKLLKMPENKGIIVSSVETNGFLEESGIKYEDVILALNGKNIDRHGIFTKIEHYHRKNIFDAFKLIPIDNKVMLTVWREGQEIQVEGMTRSSPVKKITARPIIVERQFIDAWGMTIQILSFDIFEAFNVADDHLFYQLLQNYDEYKERLVVTYVEKESSSYLQNWSRGEVISTVNGIGIEDMNHFIDSLKDDSVTYKIKSESGVLGIFDKSELKTKIRLKNPYMFLK